MKPVVKCGRCGSTTFKLKKAYKYSVRWYCTECGKWRKYYITRKKKPILTREQGGD